MALGRWLVLCVGLSAACGGDDACPFTGSTRCEEHSGPLEASYCQPDGTWSECIEAVLCNPLTHDGCDAGMSCYAVSYWEICSSPASFPCPPGQFIGRSVDGDDCRALCAHDGRNEPIENAPECDEGELCYLDTSLPDGIGRCGPVGDEGI